MERDTPGEALALIQAERLPVGSGPQLSPDQAGKPARGWGRTGDAEAQRWESTGPTSAGVYGEEQVGKNKTREASMARV